MTQTIRVFGVCLLLLGFTIAGCGDDGDGSATNGGATAGAEAEDTPPQGESNEGGSDEELEPTSESKEEYVAKANALCQKRKRQMQAEVTKMLEGLSPDASQEAALRRLVDQTVAPGLEAEIEELRELGAPGDQGGQIEAIIEAIETMLAEAREDPQAFVMDPTASERAQKLARQYGIGACGRVS